MIGYGKLLLDIGYLGWQWPNLEAEHAQAIRRVVTENGSRAVKFTWEARIRSRSREAVLDNAGLIHGSDYDDNLWAGSHPQSVAVVKVRQSAWGSGGATGQEIYEAIIVGCDCQIGAIGQRPGSTTWDITERGLYRLFAAATVWPESIQGIPFWSMR